MLQIVASLSDDSRVVNSADNATGRNGRQKLKTDIKAIPAWHLYYKVFLSLILFDTVVS